MHLDSPIKSKSFPRKLESKTDSVNYKFFDTA